MKRKWDAKSITSNPKSPLADVDLRNLLLNPMAWMSLDAEDKREILALLPDQSLVVQAGTEQAHPDLDALMNDDTFREHCSSYSENLARGYFEPEWLASAWDAHQRRKMGEFDEYLMQKFEDEWQVTLPASFEPTDDPIHDDSVKAEMKEEGNSTAPKAPEKEVKAEGGDDSDAGVKKERMEEYD